MSQKSYSLSPYLFKLSHQIFQVSSLPDDTLLWLGLDGRRLYHLPQGFLVLFIFFFPFTSCS